MICELRMLLEWDEVRWGGVGLAGGCAGRTRVCHVILCSCSCKHLVLPPSNLSTHLQFRELSVMEELFRSAMYTV